MKDKVNYFALYFPFLLLMIQTTLLVNMKEKSIKNICIPNKDVLQTVSFLLWLMITVITVIDQLQSSLIERVCEVDV